MRVSELVTEMLQGLVDAQRTATKSLITPVYNARGYGAVGDGATDDTTAIQALFDTAPAGAVIYFPGLDYKTTSTLTIRKPLVIVGVKGKTRFLSDADTVIDANGETIILTTTISSAQEASLALTLASANGIAAGDVVRLKDFSRQWPHDVRDGVYYGEMNIIRQVSDTTVTTWIPTSTDYPTGTQAMVLSMAPGFTVRDIIFERITKTSNSAIALSIGHYMRPQFGDLEFRGFGGAGINEVECIGAEYQNIHGSDGYFSGVGLGYAIQINGSIMSYVQESGSLGMRRTVDFSGTIPSRFCGATDCWALVQNGYTEDTTGFGTHGSAENIVFRNCRVSGSKNAFEIRGNYCEIDGCESLGAATYFCTVNSGYGLRISNSRCVREFGPGSTPYETTGFVNISSPDYAYGRKRLVIANCHAHISDQFINVTASGVAPSIEVSDSVIFGRDTTEKFFIAADHASPTSVELTIQDVRLFHKNGGAFNIANTVGANVTLTLIQRDFLPTANRRITSGTSAPASGTWSVSDICWNTSPAATGYIGWVCVSAGTPGTWKGFGVIQT